jgi:glycosyltransferase involved in cell wall biosynthesis
LPDVLERATILVFADDWGVHPSSAQHLFGQFLSRNRVVWFDTVGLRLPRLNWRDARKTICKIRRWAGIENHKQETRNGNTNRRPQSKQSTLLPVTSVSSRSFQSCGFPEIHDVPLVPLQFGHLARAFNFRILRSKVRACLESRPADEPLFIVSTVPLTADLADFFPEATFVYYLVDDYASWPGLNSEQVRQMDRDQARKADLIVAASRELACLHEGVAQRVAYLPHGVDLQHFAQARQIRASRRDRREPPLADVVFFGTLDERIDLQLFAAVMKARPQYRFLCLGPKPDPRSRLPELKNLQSKEAVPYQELPALLAQCRTAILPYVRGNLGKRLAPLKALEALTAGLPVVATKVPELRSLSAGACLGEAAAEIAGLLDESLLTPEQVPSLQELAEYSWENRAECLSDLLLAARTGHRVQNGAANEGWPRLSLRSPDILSDTGAAPRSAPATRPPVDRFAAKGRPIRILELRSVRGTGGGPEKTILLGAARSDPRRFEVTVCYLRDARDAAFSIKGQASQLAINYLEIQERHSFDLATWDALRDLVRERQIDIVHAHEYKTDVLAYLLAKAEGVIPLATVHGWTGHTRREQFYYAADKRLLKRFPRLIAVSGEIRKTLRRVGVPGRRVHIVRNGVDADKFRRERSREPGIRNALGIQPGEVVIGGVGRLEPQKRFDLLLQAVANLRTTHPRLRVLIAGDGGNRAKLEDLAARLGLGNSCRFLGNRSDIVDIHHAFDLFVQSSDYEGTPNAVLEAMALETPVVATAVGGTSELIRHRVDGLLVPRRDVPALAQAIEQTVTNPDLTAQRCRAARRRVESEFSFAARMQAVERIYEDLMAEREGCRVGRVFEAHRTRRC